MTKENYRVGIRQLIDKINDQGALAFIYKTCCLIKGQDDGSLSRPLKTLLILLLLDDYYDYCEL